MQSDKNQIFSQEALDKLRSPEKLDTMLTITTPVTWVALIAVLALLASVILWSIYGSFTVKADGMGLIMDSESSQDHEKLTGLLYIPLDKGKRVEPGMSIQLEPNGADVLEAGSLLGVVREVSQYPMTTKEIGQHLGNVQLAQWILRVHDAPVMEVKFDLVPDPESETGYLWTSHVEEHTPITAGSFCTGSIIIEREPPIEKIFHKFSKLLRSN